MLTLQAKIKEIKNLTPEEEFIRGTVGAKCQVNFDEFWTDYQKYVVFKRYGYEPIRVMVDNLENEIEIPYTILAESGEFKIGVFGETETQTLPTLYSDFIKIRYGTDTYGTTPPEHQISDIYQLKISKQDKLTAGDGIEIDENNVISATGGGTGGGTTNYEELDNKPKINGVELLGNKTTNELGIEIPTKLSELTNDEGYINSSALESYYTKNEINELPAIECISSDGTDIIISTKNAEALFVSYASKGYSRITSPNGDASISVPNDNNISIRTDYGIDVNESRIINVAEPEKSTDAATRGYVDGLVGDIETTLDELHNYAQAIIGGA